MSTYSYFIKFIFGASIACLLNVVAYNMPLEAKTKRLACPHCHRPLRDTQLIPIMLYLFKQDRCRLCHKQLAPLYPITELVGGFLFIIAPILLDDFSFFQLSHTWIFFSFLITITLTDIYYGLIPNKVLVTFGIILLIMQPNIFTAVTGFCIFLLSAFIGQWLFKKATLGGGDIKCYLVIGLAVDLNTLLLSIIISCLLAFLYILFISKAWNEAIAFAPFISLGIIMTMIVQSLL